MNASSKPAQYPAPTGAYKVFVKDKGLWQAHTTARLHISVGNPKHDGEKFYALTEWAAARFDHVTLIVSDTLQRHNIALTSGIDEDIAHIISRKQGDLWLARNQRAIQNLPHVTITRWDQWLNHPDYVETYNALFALYRNEPTVRQAITQKAEGFNTRHASDNDLQQASSAQIINTSIHYILEEVAAFAIMFADDESINIYPGDWFKDIFETVSDHNNSPLLESLAVTEYLRVDYVRNKSPFAIVGKTGVANDSGSIAAE
ncbi:MAG TPA: tRNA-dependent cyclodipeptide synthase [Alphaproteobacteria bacterium]